MKQIKMIFAALFLLVAVGATQTIWAQTPPIPCTPDNIPCNTCACEAEAPEGCTETSRVMLIYTTNPNCLATVHYRLRLCTTEGSCYRDRCQLIIDKIVVDPWSSSCLSCDVINETDMKAFLAQIERQILMHGAYYGGCNFLPASPTSSYNYVIAKPACWKKSSVGGGPSSAGTTTFEPCDRNVCCISSYCMTINQYGTFNIVKVGPTACPTTYDCTIISGCSPAFDICKP